jgi:hypothetical protein
MPIQHAIWKVGDKPLPLSASRLASEQKLEEMIMRDPRIPGWFAKRGYSAKASEFDLIYVNDGKNLDNLKTHDNTWKVRLIEENFHRLMFEMEGP